MPAHCSQDAIFDHNQDHRKNYTDPEPIKAPINALEVALLVKAISITQGAELIEQYARTRAAEARLDGVERTAARVFATINETGG